MSVEISEAAVQQYTDNVIHLFQQRGSVLRATLRQQFCVGRVDDWERIAKTAAVKKTVRHGKTPQIHTAHSRRMVELDAWEWSDLLDMQDRIRVLIDPRSAYVEAGGMALGRSFDLSIIAGFDAPAMAGEDGTVAVTFASEAAGDFNFASPGFTVDSLLKIKKALDSNDVPAEGRHIVLPPDGFTQLLGQSAAPNLSSKDFNDFKALVKGEIDSFLGFKFHQSTLLPSPAAAVRNGFAWHEEAMGISIAQDLSTEVTERADRSYSTQVKVFGSFGAVRVQGEGVVRFSIDESK